MTPAAISTTLDVPLVPTGVPAALFEAVSCYICGATRATPFITAEDDLTGRPGRFTFGRCDGCGLVYQSPRLKAEHVKSYYETDYIAHQRPKRWGPIAPLFAWAMGSLDRAKIRMVRRYVDVAASSTVLDVGCGAGTFLSSLREASGAAVVGVDFIDLSRRPNMAAVEFHHGPFSEQDVGDGRFDLVTMWHFLEHDYDPRGSLEHAARALKSGGRLVVEVPRLDSLSFRLFRDRWPGLQAPQHTAAYDRASLLRLVDEAELDVVDYRPLGAFPPYFYMFCGVAFCALRGRGLNLQKAIYAYFAGQLLMLPLLPVLPHLNFAMQTVVCRRRA
jgi:SAM-dependent methyltransferase